MRGVLKHFLIISILIVLLGCPPPTNFIDFHYQGKSKDHINIKVEDPKYEVDIIAYGGLGEGRNSMIYKLVIGIEIESKIPDLDFEFDTEEPEAYVAGNLMVCIHADSTSYKYSSKYTTYSRLVYQYDFSETNTYQNSNQVNDPNHIKIVLHDYLKINGKVLDVDTLKGRDPEPFYYHGYF